MALHLRDVAAVSVPGVVLFVVFAVFPFVFAAVEVTADTVGLFVLGRQVVAAGAVVLASVAGYYLVGDGAAAESPGLVFLAFLIGATLATVLGALVVWLIDPEGVTVGPAWQVLGSAFTTHSIGVAFAGLAGAAVADLGAR